MADRFNCLSLEDQCYLHLILHLEEFLPEELSLLPLRVRERLLVNLPAADICELEENAVVQGVCMNTVWKKVGQRQIKHYYDYVCKSTLDALQRGESFREHFHEVVSHSLIWEKYLGKRVPFLLYTVVNCLEISNWQARATVPVHTDMHNIGVLPSRHKTHFTPLDEKCSNEDLSKVASSDLMLFSCFKMLPCKLSIGRYKGHYACSVESTLLLQLSEIEELEIICYGTPIETLSSLMCRNTPQTSTSNIFMRHSSSKLNRVSVKLMESSYDHIIPPGTCRGVSISKIVMVKELNVSASVYYGTADRLLEDLAQTLKYQFQLERFSFEIRSWKCKRFGLEEWSIDHDEVTSQFTTSLLSTLTQLVSKANFRKLALKLRNATVLDTVLYEKLIASFFLAPPQQKRQKIEIHNINISCEKKGVSLSHNRMQMRSVSFHGCSCASESFLKRLFF